MRRIMLINLYSAVQRLNDSRIPPMEVDGQRVYGFLGSYQGFTFYDRAPWLPPEIAGRPRPQPAGVLYGPLLRALLDSYRRKGA